MSDETSMILEYLKDMKSDLKGHIKSVSDDVKAVRSKTQNNSESLSAGNQKFEEVDTKLLNNDKAHKSYDEKFAKFEKFGYILIGASLVITNGGSIFDWLRKIIGG